jgi:riboflavin biosynthesis pyrimidine reductase
VDSPEKAVGALRSMKFKRLLLGGGRRLNSSFLLSGLVNEVWIDIEPFLFGDGIRIIDANNLNVKLKVIGFRRLSRDLVQIRYEIVK